MNAPAKKYTAVDIDRIKNSIDLAGLIGAAVDLKRKGDRWVGLCPFHNESTPSFHVVPKMRMYHCFGCGANGDAIKWLQERERLGFVEAITKLDQGQIPRAARPAAAPAAIAEEPSQREVEDREKKIRQARQIWGEGVPAAGTPVEKYLVSRGLTGVCLPQTLKFHPKLWNAEKEDLFPAMIGAVVDKEARRVIAIHRTYLKADGSGKADLQNQKMILGPYRGGHVRVDFHVKGRLAIAEGIETALSVKKACPDLLVWAALSLGNMDAPIPSSVTELFLCADADNKDQKSADKILFNAAKLHNRAGRTIRIARPASGKDFNDMLRQAS